MTSLREQVLKFKADLDAAYYELRYVAIAGSDEKLVARLITFHTTLGCMLNPKMELVKLDPTPEEAIAGRTG